MAHDDSKNAVARCSFCGKPETLVHKLIEGPGVFICDECINLCYDLIDQTSSLNSLMNMLSAKMMLKLHCR